MGHGPAFSGGRMVKSSMMAAAFACFAAAANAPVREVISQAGETMGMLSPAFYKGYIYWAGREPLQIFTPDGIPGPYIAPPPGTVKAIAAEIGRASCRERV